MKTVNWGFSHFWSGWQFEQRNDFYLGTRSGYYSEGKLADVDLGAQLSVVCRCKGTKYNLLFARLNINLWVPYTTGNKLYLVSTFLQIWLPVPVFLEDNSIINIRQVEICKLNMKKEILRDGSTKTRKKQKLEKIGLFKSKLQDLWWVGARKMTSPCIYC